MSDFIDRERLKGISRMIPEGTDVASSTPEQIKQVADDLASFLKAYPRVSAKQVAKAIGYSGGVISGFMNGSYKGDSRAVALHLDAWMAKEEQRLKRPETTQFVWTTLALQVKAVAFYCLDRVKVGLVYGPESSGFGKTTALTAVAQDLSPRRCGMATIDKVDANTSGLPTRICEAVSVGNDGSNKERFNRIVQKINGRSFLLIVDQVHNLKRARNDDPLYVLMDLHDNTKTAQLWSGTADLDAYLKRGQARGNESLAQIRSRIFPIVDLLETVRQDGAASRW